MQYPAAENKTEMFVAVIVEPADGIFSSPASPCANVFNSLKQDGASKPLDSAKVSFAWKYLSPRKIGISQFRHARHQTRE